MHIRWFQNCSTIPLSTITYWLQYLCRVLSVVSLRVFVMVSFMSTWLSYSPQVFKPSDLWRCSVAVIQAHNQLTVSKGDCPRQSRWAWLNHLKGLQSRTEASPNRIFHLCETASALPTVCSLPLLNACSPDFRPAQWAPQPQKPIPCTTSPHVHAHWFCFPNLLGMVLFFIYNSAS